MDPQLQEVVKQITDAVDKRLAKRFDDVEARLSQRFDDAEVRLSQRFDDAGARLFQRFDDAEGRLSQRFDDAEGRLSQRFDEAEARLANGARANMEELKDFAKLAAEGYGATLVSLERRIERLGKKVEDGFTDHGKILRQHTQLLDQHTQQLNGLMRLQGRRRSVRR